MNPIQELFNKMTDEEVRQGILEIEESDKDGIIPDGVVRKYARLIKDETRGMSLDLLHSMIGILKQGAFRWAKGDKKYLILSGDGSWETQNQFAMECTTLEEAESQFDTLKKCTYKDTSLMLYEAKQLKIE